MFQLKRKKKNSSNSFIDVSALILELSNEQLIESADKYWEAMTVESDQCFKPYLLEEINDSSLAIASLFRAAAIFRDADVLDFGSGAGWLTNALADMGARAVGVDISENAVELSRDFRLLRRPRKDGTANSRLFDGENLPFASESFDRIVCFDAFHHAKDQRRILTEFFRVLKPGGRVAMAEPGINHSMSSASQYEMRNFKVIENDIDLPTIEGFGIDIGFLPMRVLTGWDEPQELSVQAYKQLLSFSWRNLAYRFARFWDISGVNRRGQCFALVKPGVEIKYSVHGRLNKADIQCIGKTVTLESDGARIKLSLSLKNNGQTCWNFGSGKQGVVNIGIQLVDKQSEKFVERDYLRRTVQDAVTNPGTEIVREIEFFVSREMMRNCRVSIDLVAEGVGWFSDSGSTKKINIDLD